MDSGGVQPAYRRQGIAQQMMDLQHSKVKSMGFRCIRTYTENKHKEMLILNIKFGFEVIGVFKSDHDDKQKIMLEKSL
jgi:ribosomal protein S18 acetylase RimI-like enzyme